jgi:hypothetical protein
LVLTGRTDEEAPVDVREQLGAHSSKFSEAI